MRYMMIDSRHRQVWDCNVPCDLDEDLFARKLRSDDCWPIELMEGLDLWVSAEAKSRSFRFFSDGPEYFGDGILAGRSRIGDIKGLSRRFSFEMVSRWIEWPQREQSVDRRQIRLRPTRFATMDVRPRSNLAATYAGDAPYIMQMYG
jgi:hypothetical protein